MALTILILGANSALPTFQRFSSSFVLSHNNGKFLIDAGEGCQIKLGQYKVKRSKLSDVFISHLHGDHVFGLPGLITSLNLNDRRIPLTIWGPVGLKKFLETVVDITNVHLRFPLTVNEINHIGNQKIATFPGMEVNAFPLRHRIPTYGYLFRETSIQRNLKSEMIPRYQLTKEEILSAKRGADIQRGKEKIPNEHLTFVKTPPKSFAYCSDTTYFEELAEKVMGVDLLYHEATYTKDLKAKAREYFHSTAEEAAQIAMKAKVQNLLIGHYSSRYDSLEPLLEEAQAIFPNTQMAIEGKVVDI